MKDSKNLVIGMLCAVVCIMAVAYAAFSTTLNVEGTATIASNWGVSFESISCEATKAADGGVESIVVEGETVELDATGTIKNGDTTSAEFSMTFLQPGDSAVCTVTVKNTGTLNAKVATLNFTDNADDDIITYEVDGIVLGQALNAGLTSEFTVTATYEDTETQPDTDALSRTFNLTAIYEQNFQ